MASKRHYIYILIIICSVFLSGCQLIDSKIDDRNTSTLETIEKADLSGWFGNYHFQQSSKYITYDLEIYRSPDCVWANFRLAEISNTINLKLKVTGDAEKIALSFWEDSDGDDRDNYKFDDQTLMFAKGNILFWLSKEDGLVLTEWAALAPVLSKSEPYSKYAFYPCKGAVAFAKRQELTELNIFEYSSFIRQTGLITYKTFESDDGISTYMPTPVPEYIEPGLPPILDDSIIIDERGDKILRLSLRSRCDSPNLLSNTYLIDGIGIGMPDKAADELLNDAIITEGVGYNYYNSLTLEKHGFRKILKSNTDLISDFAVYLQEDLIEKSKDLEYTWSDCEEDIYDDTNNLLIHITYPRIKIRGVDAQTEQTINDNIRNTICESKEYSYLDIDYDGEVTIGYKRSFESHKYISIYFYVNLPGGEYINLIGGVTYNVMDSGRLVELNEVREPEKWQSCIEINYRNWYDLEGDTKNIMEVLNQYILNSGNHYNDYVIRPDGIDMIIIGALRARDLYIYSDSIGEDVLYEC